MSTIEIHHDPLELGPDGERRPETPRLLFMEASGVEAARLRPWLGRHGEAGFECLWVQSLADGLVAIDEVSPACVLVDLDLADSQGLPTLEVLLELIPDIPVVVLGDDDGGEGVTAVAMGAQDYLVIGAFDDRAFVKTVRMAMERKKIEVQSRLAVRTDPPKESGGIDTAELLRVNAELEEFAFVASHDLCAPLRTVSGFIQLLAQRYEGQLDAEADEFIGFTLDGVKRMEELVQNLLEYAKLGRADQRQEMIDFEALVADTARALDAQGQVHISQLPDLPGDRAQLARVVQNLIANGLKFVPADRVPQIIVSAERSGDFWTFSVADNGIGVPEEARVRIFQMFQRLHSQDAYPGTGMGLAICHKIVGRLGGRIWVDKSDSLGSTFCFTLPA